jgi:adenosine/AMP kinase
MATAAKAARTTGTSKVRTALVETPATAGLIDPKQSQEVARIATAKQVLVNVPHGFTLTLDDGSPVKVLAGIQKMPSHIAEHWYSQKQGVKPHDLDA